jgi:creatinine amidohydrolase
VKRLLLFLFCPLLAAQSGDLVEMELMTYPEIYSAIHVKSKTTALVYNGGTEQRGPQAVLGGHTIMARRTAEVIARKLGNALVAPVLPFSLAGGHLKPEWPGSVHIDGDIFMRVNEQVVDSMMVNGFKSVVLMGDHGGGQKELAQLAKRLDAKYGPTGRHVYFCGVVYEKARVDFNEWLKQNHLPVSTHAGIPDTSELMYLGGEAYVRKTKLAAGDGKNGIVGDSRPSTPELGKRVFDMKVEYAVADIQRQIGGQTR